MTGTRARRSDVEESTWLCRALGRGFSAAELSVTLERLHRATRQIAGFFETYDLLLTPALASPPVRHGDLQPRGLEATLQGLAARLGVGRYLRYGPLLRQAADRAFRFMPFSPIWNITGQPAASLPLHWTPDGLPVGVQADRALRAGGNPPLICSSDRAGSSLEPSSADGSRRHGLMEHLIIGMSLRSLCEHFAHGRQRQAEVLGDLSGGHPGQKSRPHRLALPLLQHRRGLAGSQGSGVFCRSWIKPVKGQSGLLHRRLQLRSGSPALLHPALHFLYEPTQMLCQLGVRPAGKRRRPGRDSSFRRRCRYRQGVLEQVEGAGRRSVARHAIYMGIQPLLAKPIWYI